jgi:hypothetical protein
MVPSSMLIIVADDECLSCGEFTIGKTVHFGCLKFITDRFNGLSLSPMGDGLDAIVMGSTHSGPLSPLRAMMGDSAKEFHMALNGEGRIDLLSPR